MSALLKLIVLSVCLNTFLYLGVNYAMFETIPIDQRPDLQDDLFSILLADRDAFDRNLDEYVQSLDQSSNYSSSYTFDVTGNFSNLPNEKSGSSISLTSGGFAFLDVARMAIPLIRTIFRIAFMPLILFSYNILPPLVTLIIGIPLFILNIVTVVVLIRGGGAV